MDAIDSPNSTVLLLDGSSIRWFYEDLSTPVASSMLPMEPFDSIDSTDSTDSMDFQRRSTVRLLDSSQEAFGGSMVR